MIMLTYLDSEKEETKFSQVSCQFVHFFITYVFNL